MMLLQRCAAITKARGYGSPEFTTQVQHLARVLWRWDNVMASSALRSALRFTACMQAVNLKTILGRRLVDRRRRLVGSCGATPDPPRSGAGATTRSGLSNWPSVGDGWIAASTWRARRTRA